VALRLVDRPLDNRTSPRGHQQPEDYRGFASRTFRRRDELGYTPGADWTEAGDLLRKHYWETLGADSRSLFSQRSRGRLCPGSR
jgi:hypothetical protein